MVQRGGTEDLPRARRMARRADFLAVQGGGRKLTGAHYLVFVSPVPRPLGRLGVTVSRKVGNAVKRNRVKRWIRESYRRMPIEALPAADVVVVARVSAAEVGFADTAAEVARLLRKAAGR